ncbi:Hypothetical protein PBC10988_14930 [Planctomycetales bacterium 10988]|nr:Hypothetical protein PBC10988_14930 [Planctomycetales bacterium 10988]
MGILLLLLLTFNGCSSEEFRKHDSLETAEADQAQVDRASEKENNQVPTGNQEVVSEKWLAHYINGQQVGYDHETQIEQSSGKEKQLLTTQTSKLQLLRDGQPFSIEAKVEELLDANGQLVSFVTSTKMSGVDLVYQGKWLEKEETLQLQILRSGQVTKTTNIADRGEDGLLGVDRSCRDQPLKPGEQRVLRVFDPVLLHWVFVYLDAQSWETTKLLKGEKRLLRVKMRHSSNLLEPGNKDGGVFRAEFWIDKEGEILKTVDATMGMTSYLVDSLEEANDTTKPPSFDLLQATLIRLNARLDRPFQTQSMVYAIELKDGKPADFFAIGGNQTLEPSADNPQKAKLTVRAVSLPINSKERESISAGEEGEPSPADSQPNDWLQSKDPKIRELAEAAKKLISPESELTEDAQLAVALEKQVYRWMTTRNYSQGFASAVEAANSRTGDCTEHAVLLAALARASGFPARVAAGLVYTEHKNRPVMAYHMWTEIWLDGRWIPFDATIGQGEIGAAHIKLAESDLAGNSPMAAFLPIVKLMQRLKIEFSENEVLYKK